LDSDATRWAEVQPPDALDGERTAGGQRVRLQTAIVRLQQTRGDGADDARDDEQRAADADMLDILLSLETAADEALHRSLQRPNDEQP
jgi:hypothetical protein